MGVFDAFLVVKLETKVSKPWKRMRTGIQSYTRLYSSKLRLYVVEASPMIQVINDDQDAEIQECYMESWLIPGNGESLATHHPSIRRTYHRLDLRYSSEVDTLPKRSHEC
jgi:hypothetical protein